MKASPLQHNPWPVINMLQRSKSVGKQAARQAGYVPLAATQEGGGASNPGRYNRTVSPGPDQMAKRPPGVKRTIAPGQVGVQQIACACMRSNMQHMGLEACLPLQPAPGARSKDKFVSLPEELEELELPPPQMDVPQQLFEVCKPW